MRCSDRPGRSEPASAGQLALDGWHAGAFVEEDPDLFGPGAFVGLAVAAGHHRPEQLVGARLVAQHLDAAGQVPPQPGEVGLERRPSAASTSSLTSTRTYCKTVCPKFVVPGPRPVLQ